MTYLKMMMSNSAVVESKAKRLPNIVISLGRLETWLRAREANSRRKPNKHVKDFVFKLQSETRVLREELLQHPRFQWTTIERKKLADEGKTDGQIDNLMLPRIIQFCENEVLEIIHRRFEMRGWLESPCTCF